MDFSVEVRELSKKFGDFVAVSNISFSVKKGEIFGFLGPNGAGKSTTIRMLCGIITPSGGTGKVGGFDIISQQDSIKRTIGYMSQKFSLYGDMTVLENLEFFGSIYGLKGKPLQERINYVLDMAEIHNKKDYRVEKLPGGIKQRLALGSAIIHDPEILFLDEPTSGVDPIMRRNFWDLIYSFSKRGKTIFVTTHYMDEAEHCDRIALIISGKIIACDYPEELKRNIGLEIYSLKVDHFIEVFDLVSAHPLVTEAAIFGSDIHILCEAGVNIKKSITLYLQKHGINKFHLSRIEPTLEDVFVTYSKRMGL